MAKGMITKQNFIDYLKQNNEECFYSGTPFTDDMCDALYQIESREYTKQFCSKLSNNIVLKNVYKSFSQGLENLKTTIYKQHVDIGEN